MAQTTMVNFRIDEDVKKDMEDVDPDPFYSNSNIRYLEEKMSDYKAGRLKLSAHELLED